MTHSVSDPYPKVPSTAEQRWASEAREMPFQQLPRVREAASKWRDTLIPLVTVVTTVLAVGGSFSAKDLSDGVKLLFCVVVATALSLLIAAVFLSSFASFGIPKEIEFTGGDLSKWNKHETKRSVCLLKSSLWCFGIGIGLVGAAGVIGIYGS